MRVTLSHKKRKKVRRKKIHTKESQRKLHFLSNERREFVTPKSQVQTSETSSLTPVIHPSKVLCPWAPDSKARLDSRHLSLSNEQASPLNDCESDFFFSFISNSACSIGRMI